jgi:hypothetical protein
MATTITAGWTWTQVNSAISGAPSPDTFNWDAGTFRADADMVRRSGDIHIGAGTVDAVGEGSATIISGAIDVSSGWVADGGLWKKTGVTQGSSGVTGTSILGNPGWNGGSGNTNGSGNAEVLYIEKTWVFRVNQKAAVSGGPVTEPNFGYSYTYGTWWFDEAGDTLWIGTDPTGLTIELGVQERVCAPTDNVTFTDMTVEGFAAGQQSSPIPRGITNQTLTRMEFRLNHTYGWGVSTTTVATDVIAHHNGSMGFGGSGCNNHVITRCDAWENNLGLWNPVWEAGAYKITISNGGRMYDSAMYDNLGYGHWYDINNGFTAATETHRCVAYDNAYVGFSTEIGYDHLFEHCVSRSNGWGDLRPEWLWYGQFLCQDNQNTTFRECYAEHAQTNRWTGATDYSDGFAAINQSRGNGPDGLPYTYANLAVERCIDDFIKNQGHTGWVYNLAPTNPGTHNNMLFYGPAGMDSNRRWASGGFDTLAEWDANAGVTNLTFRSGRAPRTMTVTSSVTLNEANLVAGGAVLTFTLDEIEAGWPDWLTDWFHGDLGSDSSAYRTDLMTELIAGITGSGVGAFQWNSYVAPLIGHADFTRTNDHEFTLTLPAAPSYSPGGETLTFVIPASNMVSRQALTAGNTLDIEDTGGAVTNVVALESGWATSENTARQSPAHAHTEPTGTGTDEALVAFVYWEELVGEDATLTTLEYGGQAMTPLEDFTEASGAKARGVKMFSLDQTGIDAATDANFTFTWVLTPDRFVRIYTRFFDNVNQTSPWAGTDGAQVQAVPSDGIQWTNAEAHNDGDMGVYGTIMSSSDHTPIPPTGYTEEYDIFRADSSDNISGGIRLLSGTGTTQPFVDYVDIGVTALQSLAIAGGVLKFASPEGSLDITIGVPTFALTGNVTPAGVLTIVIDTPAFAFTGITSAVQDVEGTLGMTIAVPSFAFTGTAGGSDMQYGPQDAGNTYTYGPVDDPFN